MSNADESGTASYKIGLFGVPTDRAKSRIVVIPVPWEVTTSYGGGTARGPLTVWQASAQVDLFDLEVGRAFEKGYHLLEIPEFLSDLNEKLRPKALEIRRQLEQSGVLNEHGQSLLKVVNQGCKEMADWVHTQARTVLQNGQIPVVLGGDHSSPEGNIRAVSEHYGGQIGVLHIDAHADLRVQYQGFERSHASIMNNVMNASWKPKALVQVGIRDFCQEEYDQIQQREDIHTFFDLHLKRESFAGRSWQELCAQIVQPLPDQVYISFDVDGLSPEYCPSTGTPVPGGLSFDQACYLIRAVVESGRRIVGFDLNEVAPGPDGSEWDGNVGARLLFKLCGWTVARAPGTA